MSAGAYDITIEQGATFTLNLDYKDANDVLVLVVGTGYDCRAQIRESHGGSLIAWGDTQYTTCLLYTSPSPRD